MSHKRSKEEKPVGKNFSPKETRNLKQEKQKCEGGRFKMSAQRLLPSCQASNEAGEMKEMQEV